MLAEGIATYSQLCQLIHLFKRVSSLLFRTGCSGIIVNTKDIHSFLQRNTSVQATPLSHGNFPTSNCKLMSREEGQDSESYRKEAHFWNTVCLTVQKTRHAGTYCIFFHVKM